MTDRRLRPDPYEVLGVRRDSSSADISRAYRRLARELHPDSRPADAAAADRFRAVTGAYELLSDPAHRAAHDYQQARHLTVSPRRGAAPGISPGGPASQLRPLGPADASARMSPPPAGAAVRPGPVRIEPLPESAPAPGEDAAVWLAELLQLISRQARDGRYRAW